MYSYPLPVYKSKTSFSVSMSQSSFLGSCEIWHSGSEDTNVTVIERTYLIELLELKLMHKQIGSKALKICLNVTLQLLCGTGNNLVNDIFQKI